MNKYDTFKLESSFLSRGLAKRVAELTNALESLQEIPLPDLDRTSPAQAGALVRLKCDDVWVTRLKSQRERPTPSAYADRVAAPKSLAGGDLDLNPRFCHAPHMTSLLQTGFGMFSARMGRGRPGGDEKRFLVNERPARLRARRDRRRPAARRGGRDRVGAAGRRRVFLGEAS